MLGILTIILTIIPQNTTTNSNALILESKNFPSKFYSIFTIYRKFPTFWRKLEPQSFSIFEIIHSEKREYLNGYEVLFQNILRLPTCWRVPNTAQVWKNEFLLGVSVSLIYIMLEDVPFNHIFNLRTVCWSIASQL